MLFLQGHGVSTTYAIKIYKQYGDRAIEVVSNNPYQLAGDIYGIGFIAADTIARKLGTAPASLSRYQAGLLYVLSQATDEGHCSLPEHELIERAEKTLALPKHLVDATRLSKIIAQMTEEHTPLLQQVLNPPQAGKIELAWGGTLLRVGIR